LLTVASAVTSGMSAGAMLFIRLVLVPFWRGAPPQDFRNWFGAHSARIRELMVPLGIAATGTSTASVIAGLMGRQPGKTNSAIAAACGIGVVGITVTVNEPANEKFVQPDLDDRETAALLSKWARWHDLRVVLGTVGALAAARALASRWG
jgi:hypothetical protein